MDITRPPRDERFIAKMTYISHQGWFYEPYEDHHCPTDELLSLVTSAVKGKDGAWSIGKHKIWYMASPPINGHDTLPVQGWKIHVSATPSNCRSILAVVAPILIENTTPFKFAMDTFTLKLLNSKRWPRGASGKYITIYPREYEAFILLIRRLYSVLKDKVGPYILSDRRYKDCCCLYYRYGTFNPRSRIDIIGKHRQVLTSPQGEEIPDIRTPYFNPPPWVADPFEQTDHEDAQPTLTLDNGRFSVMEAIALSNTGGVYRGLDHDTNRDVIIKEARPFTHTDATGQDAVHRLKHESEILESISDLHISPAVFTSFSDWENFFLVEELIPGISFRDFFLQHRILLRVNPNTSGVNTFYNTFSAIFIKILHIVQELHQRGIVLGDISPKNILIQENTNRVWLIDFEASYRMHFDESRNMTTIGFTKLVVTPSGIRDTPDAAGYVGDLYAIGSLMLYALFPISTLAYVRADMYTTVLKTMLIDSGLAQTNIYDLITGLQKNTLSCDEAIQLLHRNTVFESPYSKGRPQHTQSPSNIYTQLGKYLVSHSRINGNANLFPADPFIFHTNSLSVGFGSTGIIYSLRKCGITIPQGLLNKFKADLKSAATDELPPGFLTGNAGIALALYSLGYDTEAAHFIAAANASKMRFKDHSLYLGSAGIGLANLYAYLHVGKKTYLDAALDCAKHLRETAIEDAAGVHWESSGSVYLGLGYGQSGVALFLLRLSQILRIDIWRELGERALDYDLSFAYEMERNVVSFSRSPSDHTTYLPYIEEGSAGIAKVAIRYNRWDILEPILQDAYRKYSAFAGLVYGLSGFVDVLVDAYLASGNSKYLNMAQRPFDGLRDLYLLDTGTGYATPGENLLRISCDYATGIAGVMRTVYRLHHLTSSDFCLDTDDR